MAHKDEEGRLRPLAVTAPHYAFSAGASNSLTSSEPFSLQNALRDAANRAEEGVGAWGRSDWASGIEQRRERVILMQSWFGERARLLALLESYRPNLLLIGAMSVGVPGAFKVAQLAREVLGRHVWIVLGGHHVSESMYLQGGKIQHHPASPWLVVERRNVPHPFDMYVSGDGMALVAELGEIVESRGVTSLPGSLDSLRSLPGDWCAVLANGAELIPKSRMRVVTNLPAAVCLFGTTARFSVFPGPTAHLISDSGRGCVYDCHFCSERRTAVGGSPILAGSENRLFASLLAADRMLKGQGHSFPSSFVEDSILLGGDRGALARLAGRLERQGTLVSFGAQLTIDLVNRCEPELRRLFDSGLRYLFLGIETPDPDAVGGMSKSIRRTSWIRRCEDALETLAKIGIRCGAALLFGLGETEAARCGILTQLASWRSMYGMPDPVSLNWAVQHPLRDPNPAVRYEYLDWALPTQEWQDLFSDFGEASVCYPIRGVAPPDMLSVSRLCSIIGETVKEKLHI